MPLFSRSLIHRSALALSVLSLAAILNIGLSLWIAGSIQGSATGINVAGSLRKHTYQSLAAWHEARRTDSRAILTDAVDALDTRLGSPALTEVLPASGDHPLHQRFEELNIFWRESMKPALLAPNRETPPTALVQRFLGQLESLVGGLERRTEARVGLLETLHVVSLLVTLLVIAFLFLDMRQNVVAPLKRLMAITRAIGQRNFETRAGLEGEDELSQLGQTIDQMSSELAKSYADLETRVTEKTRELQRSNAALQLLHNSSRTLYSSNDLCGGAIPLLKELEDLLGIGPIRLFLHDEEMPEPVQVLTTAARNRPYYCADHSCNACLVEPEILEDSPEESEDGCRLLLPIQMGRQLLGTLEVWYRKTTGLREQSRHLLETLSDQLANAIALQRQRTEEQQVTLAEERAIIARELHDSLAQSLSYLKMQVARMHRLEQKGGTGEQRLEVLDELSVGLNNAYRQLRELLTTFRLKLDTPDLNNALEATIREFSERLSSPVDLTFNLPPAVLSPNEEIHVLQVVREALSNAVKHAEATRVIVSVTFDSPQVIVCVRDNGKGLPESDQPMHHYGLIIMQDRARTLGGKLSVGNHPSGGAEVRLAFIPQNRNVISSSQASTA